MTQIIEEKHFFIGTLPGGKVVAASNTAPFFCFRADDEEAVLKKVEAALTFYFQSERVTKPAKPAHRTATVTSWADKRAVPFRDYVHAGVAA